MYRCFFYKLFWYECHSYHHNRKNRWKENKICISLFQASITSGCLIETKRVNTFIMASNKVINDSIFAKRTLNHLYRPTACYITLFQSSLLWFNHLSTNLERFREDNCYSIIENTFTKHQRVKRHIHVQVTKTLIDWLLFHSNFNFSVQ